MWPGSVLDKLWLLNKPAYKQLSPEGSRIGPAFLFLSVTLVATASGWFKRRLWGWRFAVGIIATQVGGDFVNLLRGELLRGLVGLVIASALFFYLLRKDVRAAFR